jgi:predicted RNA-binding Zn ribbon-like protein
MRKTQQAPGDLEHVRAFVNTIDFDEGTEQLSSPVALDEWLTDAALTPASPRASRADLQRARALREALRAVLLAHNDGEPPAADACEEIDRAACRARLRLRFDADCGPWLDPESSGVDAALGRLLAIVQRASSQGTWERLKACRWDTCEWAFYDHTKNHSGTWCSMEVCGNRAKARTYRERRSVAHPPTAASGPG